MFQVCPLCGDTDDVIPTPLGPGLVEYSCKRARNHPDGNPYTWRGRLAGPDADEESETGPAFELGMLDDLFACVQEGEPWLEYGIVERRYRERSPEAFAELVARWGHREDGHQRAYTSSSYIGTVLAMLRRRNLLVSLPDGGPGTGYWSYNNPSSYWARPPGPPRHRIRTFVQWATDHGHDPHRP